MANPDPLPKDTWGLGGAYEQYVGRWSRLVAREFLAWLGPAPGLTWGDAGCGTGALAQTILQGHAPRAVFAVDRSAGFLSSARAATPDRRAGFACADVLALPWAAGRCDVTVSGLVLNFVRDHAGMLRELVLATRPGGQVALYVWDYLEGMEMMRYFWDVATALNPQAATLDQAERFPICRPAPLRELFAQVGLAAPEVRAIEIPATFRDFDDYWAPFLGKQGPAPVYLAAQSAEMAAQIRETLRARLPTAADGSIALMARAWAVKGTV